MPSTTTTTTTIVGMPPATKKARMTTREICPSFVSGMFTAICFNPWDRALYLAVVEKRPFLSKSNWVQPFQGLSSVIVQRTASAGLYFGLESFIARNLFKAFDETSLTVALSGFGAGCLNGSLLNFIQTTKYQMWRTDGRTFTGAARDMYKMSGGRPFLKGISATVSRDAMWGASYTFTRKCLYTTVGIDSLLTVHHNNWQRGGCDFIAGGVAAVVSSPFNYARNIQYASCPSGPAPSISHILQDLWHETKGRGIIRGGLLLEKRMRLGWGFLRTSLGTSVGHYIFRGAQHWLGDND